MEKTNLNIKQKLIIEFLLREGRLSTSKIASYIGLPTDYARKNLELLKELNILKKEEETNATYWKISEGYKNAD